MLYHNLPQIDLHGMDREYAAFLVKDFITDAIVQKEEEIVIIHGIGSGILRKAIHTYLKTDRRVEAYKLDFMNPGCTIVKLKNT